MGGDRRRVGLDDLLFCWKVQGFPARQKPWLRRGVPFLHLAPDVSRRIGDIRGEAAEGAASASERGEGEDCKAKNTRRSK